ncbi:InlB B-repeat-containing protein [Paenibacillus polysaccharolyticus]|uniref:InlB B-repeat-containing protein n=1 Tax=Paenibacillus polysaccharolyticus TaxID=582692 RepID=UPI00203B403F
MVEGSLVTTPAEPVREGYVFGGWYSDEGLTTVYDFATPVTANMTLHVKWKALFTVKFDAGIDRTPALRKIVVEGDVAHAPDPSELPSNPGNIIYGWTKNFSTKIPYDFETPVTGNFTLIAIWSGIYTVNFETNGGSAVETPIYAKWTEF